MSETTATGTADVVRKSFDFTYKALDDAGATGGFELYAAVFGNVDRVGDLIEPGAFIGLDAFVADGLILWDHDLGQLPIGFIDEAVQDAKGLRIKGRYHSTPRAQECRATHRERQDAGKSVKCSIGFRPGQVRPDTWQGRPINRIQKALPVEASFVNLPANPLAGTVAVKSEAGPAASPGADMPEQQDPTSIIDRVRLAFGLQVKAGRAISRKNREDLKTFGDSMCGHAAGSKGIAKGLRELAKGLNAHADEVDKHGDVSGAIGAGLLKHLAKFDPDAEPEDDDQAEAEPETKGDDDERARILQLRSRQGPRPGPAA